MVWSNIGRRVNAPISILWEILDSGQLRASTRALPQDRKDDVSLSHRLGGVMDNRHGSVHFVVGRSHGWHETNDVP